MNGGRLSSSCNVAIGIADDILSFRYTGVAVDPSAAKEVRTTDHDAAMVVIGIAMLMMAFTTLVIKIIEVARSK